MSEQALTVEPDRLLLKLEAGGPIELEGLSNSFAALSRIYARHYGANAGDENPPKLYITKLETGSVWAEIAPYATMMGLVVPWADSANVVAEFTRRLTNAIRAFADLGRPKLPMLPVPTHEDARDIREFVRPLTGKKGAQLGISHARYEAKTADRHVIAEYVFREEDLNRAAVNIDNIITALAPTLTPETKLLTHENIRREVMLFFEQASRSPGKEEGRTGDKAVVPDICKKALPTYFRKGVNDLKDQMIRGEQNPLTFAFIVDVHVQIIDGEPKGYLVTDVHKFIPLG